MLTFRNKTVLSRMSQTPRALYVEINSYCVAWLRNLISRGLIADGDVADFSLADLRPSDLQRYTQVHFCAGIGVWSYSMRRGGWPDSRRAWTASLPCQPFSAAGKGEGFADERHLWPYFFHLVKECRPDVVLGEQVASKDGLTWLDLVQSDLEGARYAFGSVDSCSAGFGAPHIRQRMYWMAHAEHAVGRSQHQIDGEAYGRDGLGRSGVAGTLDHAADARHGDTWQHDGGPSPRAARPVEHGGAGTLANTNASERRTDATGGHERDGNDAGWPQGAGDVEGCGKPRSLANDAPSGRREECADTGGLLGGDRSQGDAAGLVHGDHAGQLEQPHNGRCEGPRLSAERVDGSGKSLLAGSGQIDERDGAGAVGIGHNGAPELERPGPVNGFWSDADWIFCRDGKWRPIEPGSFPLAHGLPRSMGTGGPELRRLAKVAGIDAKSLARAKEYRIGSLRAYGNAINAEQAADFCAAALDWCDAEPALLG